VSTQGPLLSSASAASSPGLARFAAGGCDDWWPAVSRFLLTSVDSAEVLNRAGVLIIEYLICIGFLVLFFFFR
jgi:hypothetical protein